MKLWSRITALFHRGKLDADMAEEMRLHLERRAAEHVAEGMSSQEARYAALRKFGGVDQVKEAAREQRGWIKLEQVMQDLRHAGRGLRRQPGFASVAVLTLALGIGATTTLFSLVNRLWWQPLPYREPARLVRVWDTNTKRGLTEFSASLPNLVSWQSASRRLEAFAAWRYGSATLTTPNLPEQIEVVRITANLLSLLGVSPIAGRDFTAAEGRPGDNRIALISAQFWQQRFQGIPAAFGQTLILDGEPHTIVGVAPAELETLTGAAVWTPLGMDAAREPRNEHWLRVVGRLRPGVSLALAQQEMNTIATHLAEEFPDSNENWGVRLESFHDWIVPAGVRKSLLLLFGAVACVLLISAANLSILLLIRAVARAREIAVRAALGAGRGRIARQFATEAALLVFVGAGAGWLLANAGVAGLRWLRPGNLPRLDELQLDGVALMFTFGVTLFTAVFIGLLPALQAARFDLQQAMKDGGGTGISKGRQRVQSALVVAQVALSSILLIGAALFAQSLLRLQAPLGFDAANVQLFRVPLPELRYRTPQEQAGFYEALTERINALPGVKHAGATNAVPFDAALYRFTTRVDARASALPVGEMLSMERFNVGADYFRAIEVALRAGRFFDGRDAADATPVVILNEAAAGRLWPGEDPVGKTVIWNRPLTVIGVVGDARNIVLDRAAQPAFYLPVSQRPVPTMTIAVRSTGENPGLTDGMRRVLTELDRELPWFDVRPLTQLLDQAAARPRFNTGLLGAFAAVALLLATIGLYGVTAYGVECRKREFGLRLALGAPPPGVQWIVLKRGAIHTVIGIGVGLLLALGFSRLMRGLLQNVATTDAATYAGVALFLFVVSLFASWIPARRAARVDPMVALRSE